MGKWMCPNHPEHFVDSTLLTSHSLSERVKLWDKFSVPIDQDSVRVNFLQRCHRKNPPFRYKVKRALRSRIRVPLAVKEQYSEPPDLLLHHGPPQHLLPSVTEHETEASTATTVPTTTANRIATTSVTSCGTTVSPWLYQQNWRGVEVKEEPVENSEILQDRQEGSQKDARVEDKRNETERKKPTKEEMDEWLAGLLCLQASIIKHMANNTASGLNKTPEKQRAMNGPTCIGSTLDASPPLERPGCMNGDLTSHDISSKHSRFADPRRHQPIMNSNFQPPPTYLPAKKGILKNQKGK
nr:PHD finger protein 12-like [Cherax quadricarinatus]